MADFQGVPVSDAEVEVDVSLVSGVTVAKLQRLTNLYTGVCE